MKFSVESQSGVIMLSITLYSCSFGFGDEFSTMLQSQGTHRGCSAASSALSLPHHEIA